MHRRAFFTLAGAGLVARGPGGSSPAVSQWDDEDVDRSKDYRLLKELEKVDWIEIGMIDQPKAEFLFEFIDIEEYPEHAAELLIPVDRTRWPNFRVDSSVPCSILMDHNERPIHHVRLDRRRRPGPSIFFEATVTVRVYLSAPTEREVRIVARPA